MGFHSITLNVVERLDAGQRGASVTLDRLSAPRLPPARGTEVVRVRLPSKQGQESCDQEGTDDMGVREFIVKVGLIL